ncbi:MAG: transporter substrate-binding domain-containing protein [Proteobacteria bacterium]|nr:transporter substrate-binding domain-containing protein [Pseudomonadota bacterium]MBU1611203.1 transporter substrate-binding domain-containing protein [Pseudomonadota bacterium]
MTLWRTIRIGTVVLIAILGLATAVWAADVRQELTQASTLDMVAKRGTLKVGMSTFVPWAMKAKSGELIGFEIDVAKKLADDMGVAIQFVPTKWDNIIPALMSGKFDVIIGGMGITAERNLKVNFTIPYEFSGMSIMANAKNAGGLNTLEDFNKPSITIAVRLGTTAEKATKKYLPKATLKQFTDEAQTIQELLNGRANAVVASAPLPEQTVAKYPDSLYLPLDSPFTKEPIGFVVKKGDPDFMNFLNNWIMVNDYQGFLKERFDYWFKTLDWQNQIQ